MKRSNINFYTTNDGHTWVNKKQLIDEILKLKWFSTTKRNFIKRLLKELDKCQTVVDK